MSILNSNAGVNAIASLARGATSSPYSIMGGMAGFGAYALGTDNFTMRGAIGSTAFGAAAGLGAGQNAWMRNSIMRPIGRAYLVPALRGVQRGMSAIRPYIPW